jgi:hypothetical protein
MKLIDRYVFAVTRGLPQSQREDIEKELRTLIEDMMEEYEEIEPEESRVEKVLLDLGDPAVLADKYRDSKRYLISPQNFDNYIFVLKIVLGAVLIGVSIAEVLGVMFLTDKISIANTVGEYLLTLVSSLIQGFAWVTGIFAVLEYKGVRLDGLEIKRAQGGIWSISDLPEIPEDKAVISSKESIFSIIFSTTFIIILCFAPKLLGVFTFNKQAASVVIPIFNVEILNGYRIFIFGIFLIGLFKEILKIISGRWTLKLSLSVVILNIIELLLVFVIFSNTGIFNDKLPVELVKYGYLDFDFTKIWNMVKNWIVISFIVAYILESATALYKGFLYNNN